LARRLVQERIVVMDPADEMLPHFVEALSALNLALDAIGALEPPRRD
jgi:hypothetical protein